MEQAINDTGVAMLIGILAPLMLCLAFAVIQYADAVIRWSDERTRLQLRINRMHTVVRTTK